MKASTFFRNVAKVALAEIFDATWVLGMLIATVTGRPSEVLLGVICGLTFAQWAAASIGARINTNRPEKITQAIAMIFIFLACLFLLKAFQVIEFEYEAFFTRVENLKPLGFFFATMGIIAFLEFFDKSAAVTLHTAASTGDRLGTFLSSMLGLTLVNSLGIFFFSYGLQTLISAYVVELGSAIVFGLAGLVMLVGRDKILSLLRRKG